MLADRFCGRIVAWGPRFYEVKYLDGPNALDPALTIKNQEYLMSGDLSTGDAFDDATRCLPVSQLVFLS